MTRRWTVFACWWFAKYGFLAGAISVFFLALAVPTRAQSAEEAARIARPLSGQSRATIQRLSGLDALPADGWKTHVGDLAHGEALDLDDSSWPIVRPEAEAGTDAVWYRRSITVPPTLNGYDLTGARIWFSFHADANGPMPEIIYFNGRRVAMGDDLEPIVLFDQAKPGDKVLVAVKLLHTVDKRLRRDGTEDRFRREPAESRGSEAGDPVFRVADSWVSPRMSPRTRRRWRRRLARSIWRRWTRRISEI